MRGWGGVRRQNLKVGFFRWEMVAVYLKSVPVLKIGHHDLGARWYRGREGSKVKKIKLGFFDAKHP